MPPPEASAARNLFRLKSERPPLRRNSHARREKRLQYLDVHATRGWCIAGSARRITLESARYAKRCGRISSDP